jgi:pimeloyl-ACP methyl ester carboxylesterase
VKPSPTDVIEPIQLGQGIAARIAPGDGEKILWIHGYTIDSGVWGHLWRLLPEWHHIGIDLPGHGASDPWPPNPTLPDLARLIGSLAIEQRVQHVVALSFGTVIALQVIMEFPGAFASLTLGAPAIGGGPQEASVGDRYKELFQVYMRYGPGPKMTELWMKFPPNIFKGASAHPKLWQELIAVLNRHSWAELRTGAMRYLPYHTHTTDMLQQVETPTLVLVGEEEMKPFKETAVILQNHLPHCETVHLPQAGHLCMLEVPDPAAKFIAKHLRTHATQP